MNLSTEAKQTITKILIEETKQWIEEEEQTAIEAVENGVREICQMMGCQIIQAVLEAKDSLVGKTATCKCEHQAKRIMGREGTIITVFGKVTYERSYYGCEVCGEKWYELDRQLGIKPGEVSAVLGKLLAIAGVETAFEKAKKMMKAMLMIDISDNTIRKETQEAGEEQRQIEEEWIDETHDENWLQEREREEKEPPERLYGSVDGAHIPIGEEWRELKTLSWYRVGKIYGEKEPKAQEISYHTDIKPAQEFGKLLWATGVRRMADKAKELIFVCDGAAWIWNLVSHYFPQAVQIVDWYHACEYLSPIAEAAFDTKEQRQAWVKKLKTWLWHGRIKKVIQACSRLLDHPDTTQAAHRAVTYYTNNQHRMDYPTYRKKGYWIGSGTIESACKQIASARMKIAGARWTLEGAIATAKARAAWLSDDDSFDRITSYPLAV
jgi:hypothetical protein